MASPQFGAIERKPLRDFWPNEAADFTPWLKSEDNLSLLGEAIGLNLELVGSEVPVGPYSADIVCLDVDDQRHVVIENQLEQSDHNHLGQLLTYAGGLGDVSTVVWIARDFTEEHRAALDWLNNSTTQDVGFFGLAIEVWQIGDSLPAPRFTLVSKPNEWSKTKPQPGLSSRQEMQLAYWTAFIKERVGSAFDKGFVREPKPQSSMLFTLGRTGVVLSAVATRGDPYGVKSEDHIRVEIVTRGANGEAIYDQIKVRQVEIESKLGTDLIWAGPVGGLQSRIYVSKDADATDHDDWPDQHRWLLAWLQKFDDVFRPIVQNLDA